MTSSPDMPEMFERLTGRVGEWAQKYPEPFKVELTSDRELTGADELDHVEVTMRDFKVQRLVIDKYWFQTDRPSLAELGDTIAAAVNEVLGQYLQEELLAVESHQVPMAEIHEGLKELSADFAVAYQRAFDRIPKEA